MNHSIGFGTVGYGMIGRTHLVAMQANRALFPEGPSAYPRALCTRSPQDKQSLPYEALYTSLDDMLADDEVQVVDICTPNDMHHDQALATLRAQKGLYLEKPLAETLAKAAELRDAVGRDAVAQCALMLRFRPDVARLKDLVQGGAIGEVIHFRGCFFHGTYLTADRPTSWRQQFARSGGGAIMDLGVHILDMMRWVLGEAASVKATAKTVFAKRYTDESKTQTVPNDTDEYLCAMFQMQSGAVGTIEASRVSHSAKSDKVLEIFGTKGSLCLDWDDNSTSLYQTRPAGGGVTLLEEGEAGPLQSELQALFPFGRSGLGAFTNAHASAIQNLCYWQAGLPRYSATPDFAAAYEAQRLVHACLQSAESGESVRLEDVR